MTLAATKLPDEFETLPEDTRSEVVAEIARRVALFTHDLPADEDLIAAADRLLLEMDRREQQQ